MRPQRRVTPVTPAEIVTVLEVCEAHDSAAGRRDALLLHLLISLGFPRKTVVNLRLEQVRENAIPLAASTPGIPLPAHAVRLLQRWREVYTPPSGPLFTPVEHDRIVPDKPLGLSTLATILARRCHLAGVPPFSLSDVHVLRVATLCGVAGRDCCCSLPGAALPFLEVAEPAALRLLRRMNASKRRVALKLLNEFARHCDPGQSALTLSWCRIPPQEFARATRRLAQSQPLRTLNATRTLLVQLLKEEMIAGSLNQIQAEHLAAALGGRLPVIHGGDPD